MSTYEPTNEAISKIALNLGKLCKDLDIEDSALIQPEEEKVYLEESPLFREPEESKRANPSPGLPRAMLGQAHDRISLLQRRILPQEEVPVRDFNNQIRFNQALGRETVQGAISVLNRMQRGLSSNTAFTQTLQRDFYETDNEVEDSEECEQDPIFESSPRQLG